MAKDLAELLALVLVSPPFAKAPKARKLLNYLFESRDKFVSGEDISKLLWNLPLEEHDGERVRERIHDLRMRLREIAEVTVSSFYFELPDNTGEGYRLKFPDKEGRGASAAFWRPHTKAEDVALVYAEPVFFYDAAATLYIRYLDTNPVDLRSAVGDLEVSHGKELRKLYESPLSEKLVPRTAFMGIGEIASLEILSEWFWRRSYLRVRRQPSNRISSVQEGCPVLIGSERTNRFIGALLNSEEGEFFQYRLHSKIGFVTMKEATKKEKAALKKFSVKTDALGQTIAGNSATLSVVRDRLALLHRMPTPSGKGTVTMISSDAPLAIRQLVVALTDDEQAGRILEAAGWTEETLPKSLEMMFAVRVAPANIDHEAGLAELIAWRGHGS